LSGLFQILAVRVCLALLACAGDCAQAGNGAVNNGRSLKRRAKANNGLFLFTFCRKVREKFSNF
jgi:hypothetical protein